MKILRRKALRSLIYLMLSLFVLALPGLSLASNSARAVCDDAKLGMKHIFDQLPIDVDYMTQLVGMNAIVVGDRCEIRYQYVMDERKAIELVRSSMTASERSSIGYEETIRIMNSEKYRNGQILWIRESGVLDPLQHLVDYPLINVYMHYSYNGPNLRAFSFPVR